MGSQTRCKFQPQGVPDGYIDTQRWVELMKEDTNSSKTLRPKSPLFTKLIYLLANQFGDTMPENS